MSRHAAAALLLAAAFCVAAGCALHETGPPRRGLDPERIVSLEAPPPGPNEADLVVSAELSRPVLAGISPPPREYAFTVVVDGRGLARKVGGEPVAREVSPVAKVRAMRYAFITRIRSEPGTVRVGLRTRDGSAGTTVDLSGGEVLEVVFTAVYRSASPARRSLRLVAPGEDPRRGVRRFDVEVRAVEQPGPAPGEPGSEDLR